MSFLLLGIMLPRFSQPESGGFGCLLYCKRVADSVWHVGVVLQRYDALVSAVEGDGTDGNVQTHVRAMLRELEVQRSGVCMYENVCVFVHFCGGCVRAMLFQVEVQRPGVQCKYVQVYEASIYNTRMRNEPHPMVM